MQNKIKADLKWILSQDLNFASALPQKQVKTWIRLLFVQVVFSYA